MARSAYICLATVQVSYSSFAAYVEHSAVAWLASGTVLELYEHLDSVLYHRHLAM